MPESKTATAQGRQCELTYAGAGHDRRRKVDSSASPIKRRARPSNGKDSSTCQCPDLVGKLLSTVQKPKRRLGVGLCLLHEARARGDRHARSWDAGRPEAARRGRRPVRLAEISSGLVQWPVSGQQITEGTALTRPSPAVHMRCRLAVQGQLCSRNRPSGCQRHAFSWLTIDQFEVRV